MRRSVTNQTREHISDAWIFKNVRKKSVKKETHCGGVGGGVGVGGSGRQVRGGSAGFGGRAAGIAQRCSHNGDLGGKRHEQAVMWLKTRPRLHRCLDRTGEGEKIFYITSVSLRFQPFRLVVVPFGEPRQSKPREEDDVVVFLPAKRVSFNRDAAPAARANKAEALPLCISVWRHDTASKVSLESQRL